MITRQQLIDAANQCERRDFGMFAELVTRLDPVLGTVVRMHANEADGNSPDIIDPDYVGDWIDSTMEEAVAIQGMTANEASRWWHDQYAF